MLKTIKFLGAAAAALTATIGMAGETPRSFTQDGHKYVYTKTVKADGRTVIDGRRYPAGAAFHLVVRDGRVTGLSGGQPVSFKVTEANGAASSAVTAD